jgi:hypothetical protein
MFPISNLMAQTAPFSNAFQGDQAGPHFDGTKTRHPLPIRTRLLRWSSTATELIQLMLMMLA